MQNLGVLVAIVVLAGLTALGREEKRVAAVGKLVTLTLYAMLGARWGGPFSLMGLVIASSLAMLWVILALRTPAPWTIALLLTQALQLMLQGVAYMGYLAPTSCVRAVHGIVLAQVLVIASTTLLKGRSRRRTGYVTIFGAR